MMGQKTASTGKWKAMKKIFKMTSPLKQSTWTAVELVEGKPSFVTICYVLQTIQFL